MGRFLPFVPPAPPPPPLSVGPGSGKSGRYLRHTTAGFSCLFKFALPTPSSAQSRRLTRVPCSRITWYGAIGHCVLFFWFWCVSYLFYFFRLNTSPTRGAVGDVTFHSGYISFPHPTPPPYPSGPRKALGMISPLY